MGTTDNTTAMVRCPKLIVRAPEEKLCCEIGQVAIPGITEFKFGFKVLDFFRMYWTVAGRNVHEEIIKELVA